MLTSTLTLHRANHLLQYRNLASEPMPPPLPPSLHPPQPVGVSDFDIDFILTGSEELMTRPSSGPDTRSRQHSSSSQRQPAKKTSSGAASDTLKLGPGGENEDSFAKFVGEFDNEYGDRRGDWTFRACPVREMSSSQQANVAFQWDSRGAGSYSIDVGGKVESEQSGQALLITRIQPREFEVEVIRPPRFASSAGNILPVNSCFVLAPKQAHNELGGVKTLTPARSLSRSEDSPVQREENPIEVRSLPSGSALRRILSHTLGETSLSHVRRETTDPTPTLEHDVEPSVARRYLVKYHRHVKSTQSSPSPEDSLASSSASSKDKKKDRPSIGDKIKRSWLAGLNRSYPTPHDEKRERQRERQREKMAEKSHSHSWSAGSSGSSGWSAGSAGSLVYPNGDPSRSASKSLLEGTYQPPWLLLAEGVPKDKMTVARAYQSNETAGEGGPVAGAGDETSGALGFKHGKAWESVPNDAVAMVLPLDPPGTAVDLTPVAAAAAAGRPSSEGWATFFTDAPARLLLVYYVPFVSRDDAETRPTTGSRKFTANRLLRRRPKSFGDPGDLVEEQDASQAAQAAVVVGLQALPFKSFRIVACVVSPNDLRSEPDLPEWPAGATPESRPETLASNTEDDASQSRFPTVIAVCHSRSQGVEFVMEGLDRLGLCKRSGASPWGAMGYEEWRGGGLTDAGRSLLDVLWAGCVCVLGLGGAGGGAGKVGVGSQR